MMKRTSLVLLSGALQRDAGASPWSLLLTYGAALFGRRSAGELTSIHL